MIAQLHNFLMGNKKLSVAKSYFSFIKKMLLHISKNFFVLRYLPTSFFWKNKMSNCAKSLIIIYKSSNVCKKIWFCNEIMILNETLQLSLKKAPQKPHNLIIFYTIFIWWILWFYRLCSSDLQLIDSPILKSHSQV